MWAYGVCCLVGVREVQCPGSVGHWSYILWTVLQLGWWVDLVQFEKLIWTSDSVILQTHKQCIGAKHKADWQCGKSLTGTGFCSLLLSKRCNPDGWAEWENFSNRITKCMIGCRLASVKQKAQCCGAFVNALRLLLPGNLIRCFEWTRVKNNYDCFEIIKAIQLKFNYANWHPCHSLVH